MDAIEFGHDCCKKIAAGIRELVRRPGKTEADIRSAELDRGTAVSKIADAVRADLTDALNTQEIFESSRATRVDQPEKKAVQLFTEETAAEAGKFSRHLKERIFRDEMLKNAAVPMAARSTRSAPLRAKSACCRAPMAPRSSRAVKRRRW